MKEIQRVSVEPAYSSLKMRTGLPEGVDRGLIKKIVDRFYQLVAEDEELGPVFDRRLHGSWDAHLEKMYDFWANVVLGEQVYSGNPMRAHVLVKEIEPEHFTRWLHLFDKTLNEVCEQGSQNAAFAVPAERMAEALVRQIRIRDAQEYPTAS